MKYCNVQRVDKLTPLPESVSVCTILDDDGDEKVITELMIHRACKQMDADQIWPFASQTLFAGMRPVSSPTAEIIQFPGSLN